MSNGEEQPAQPEARPAGATTGLDRDLNPALQRHVQQALQPVLAEFQQQMAQAVREQMELALKPDGSRRQQPLPGAESDGDGPPQPAPAPEPGRENGRQPAEPAHGESTETGDSTGQSGIQRLWPALSGALLQAFPEALRKIAPEILEHQAEQWLRSRLEVGLDAVFSDSARATLQRELEQGVRSLLQVSLEILPEEDARRDLQHEAEQTLQTVVRETLDTVFEESVRDELQQHGEQAIHALIERDFRAALDAGKESLRTLLKQLLAVLQGHLEQVLQLVLKVILRGIQDRLGSTLKEGFTAISTATPKELPGKAGEATEAIRQKIEAGLGGDAKENTTPKDEDLREQMARAVEAFQQRLKQETSQLQQRVAEGMGAAVKEATHGEPGQPPHGGREPSGQASASARG